MKALRFGRSAALLSVAAIALTACGGNGGGADSSSAAADGSSEGSAAATGTLIGGGASSQEAAMTAWAEGVKETSPELAVQYSPDGSGAGREGFIGGAFSFAGSDAALKEDEVEQAKQVCGENGAFHVPAYISPIAVAFKLDGVESVNMDADTLAKVFSKKITTWNDPAIAKLNEGVELPDTPITVVHRSDESGTTENFTDYLAEVTPESWTYEADKKWPADITAESAQGTKGVVAQAAQTDGAITYADASAVGELSTVKVGAEGKFAEVSPEAAAKIVSSSEQNEDGSIKLDRKAAAEDVYPIVLVSYHIYCNQYQDQATVDQVKTFGEYVVSEEGQKAAQEAAHSAPISAETAEAAKKRIEAISAAG